MILNIKILKQYSICKYNWNLLNMKCSYNFKAIYCSVLDYIVILKHQHNGQVSHIFSTSGEPFFWFEIAAMFKLSNQTNLNKTKKKKTQKLNSPLF